MGTLGTSPAGDLYYINGEVLNRGTVDDPVAYRGGGRGRSLVKWTGDHIRPDGVHDELVLDQYKRDEVRLRAGDAMCGEVTRHLRAPGQSGADTLIQTARFDGVIYHVPIIAAAGIVGGSGGVSSFLRSPNGRYEMEMQDDGVVVVYDEHNGHTPVSAFRIGFGL